MVFSKCASALVAVLSVTQLIDAHICIMKPEQRGGFNVSASTPGQPSCYRRTGYCGAYDPMSPKADATFHAGEEASITFEQNLNHWYPPRPGFLDISISYNTETPTDRDFVALKQFADFPAFEMVTRTVFDIKVTLPKQTADHAILRFRYVSNNPDEIDPKTNTDAIFYNCADIKIVEAPLTRRTTSNNNNNNTAPAKKSTPLPGAGTAYSCDTPPSWVGMVSETNDWGVVQHVIHWDDSTMFVRWDQSGDLDGTGTKKVISCINDYTKPVEYVQFKSPAPERCPTYGNDKYYQWSYGERNTQMTYEGRQDGIDHWSAGDGMYKWTTKEISAGVCQPVSWSRGQSTFIVNSFMAGPISPSVFVPDAQCKTSKEFVSCNGAKNATALL